MPRHDALRRHLVRGLLTTPGWAALALGAGCANPSAIAPPPGADPLPAPAIRVGDRWRYRLTNLYNGSTIGETAVEVLGIAPEIRLRVDPGQGEPVLEERYADAWTVIAESIYDAPMVFDAPMPVVPRGARPGQSIASRTRYRSPLSNERLDWAQRLRVVGWERVTVPAGTFDALRIERLVDFRHPDFFRYLPDRIDVLWHAPAVGRWVQREWTGTYMPGSPVPRGGRANEERVRWSLTAWQPGRAT
jgi:hypothetical protein